jgi:small-conductance mechanosensitive channel
MDSTAWLLSATPPWLVAIASAVVATLGVLFIERTISGRVARWLARSGFTTGNIIVESLRIPIWLISLIGGCLGFKYTLVALGESNLATEIPLDTIALVLLILAIVAFADRFSVSMLGNYSKRTELLRDSKSIVKGVTRGLVFGIGALVLLGTLGVSITPVIASLGITSLAVALALQPTLENFFSGVQLVIDKPIRVGDFIELESGEQGFVDRIGWRSTWIRMLPNNTVIIPNSVLSGSKVINYFYPEKELSVPVEVGVHYDSDLEHVERITLEVAREVLRTHEWGVTEYDTFVVYTGFGDSSINFTVMLRAKEYFNRFWVRSAFIKALHKRYAQEGITIPYPIRALNLTQEGSAQVQLGLERGSRAKAVGMNGRGLEAESR